MVRDARPADAEQILDIYTPSVLNSHVSFEEAVPSEAQMRERIGQYARTHAWLVAEEEERIAGYAFGCPHRTRAAYRWSAEAGVYVRADMRGRGVGLELYRALFARLRARGYHSVFAGIALPNDASVALHRKAGFTPVGVFRRVGYKNGAWRDTSWWQLQLTAGAEAPAELLTP